MAPERGPSDARRIDPSGSTLRKAARDLIPFVLVTGIGLATIPLGPTPGSWLVIGLVVALTPVLLLGQLFVSSGQLPAAFNAVPTVGAVVGIEVLRQGQGGTTSGYIPLFMLPLVWAGLHGTRRHVALVATAIGLAVASPLVLHSGPANGNEVRRALLWAVTAFFIGFAIKRLVTEVTHHAAIAETLAAEMSRRERELDLLVRSSRDAIVRFDTAGTFLYASPSTVDVLGWRPDELVGTSGYSRIHPDDQRDMLDGGLRDPQAASTAHLSTFRLLRPDGSYAWVESHRVSIRDDTGTVVEFQSTIRNVDERRAADAERRLAERRFEDSFANATVGMAVVGLDGSWLDVNDTLCATLGRDRSDLLAQRFQDVSHPDDLAAELELVASVLAGHGDRYDTEKRYLRPEGSAVPAHLYVSLVRDEEGHPLHFISQVVDLTELTAALEAVRVSEESLRAVASAVRSFATGGDVRAAICGAAGGLPDIAMAWLLERDGAVFRVTASTDPGLLGRAVAPGEVSAAATVFASGERLTVDDIAGRSDLSAHLSTLGLHGCLFEPVRQGRVVVGVLAAAWSCPLADVPLGSITTIGLLAEEAATVIERGDLLEQLDRLARHDALTGLENRRAFDEELPRELSRANRSGRPLSIAMIDLDHFKLYNDAHGHQAGDELLASAARAWSDVLRADDRLVRYGGEEFVLLLPDCELDGALVIAERIRELVPGGQTCSVGVAQWRPGESAESLLRRADDALYDAKRDGRDRVALAAA